MPVVSARLPPDHPEAFHANPEPVELRELPSFAEPELVRRDEPGLSNPQNATGEGIGAERVYDRVADHTFETNWLAARLHTTFPDGSSSCTVSVESTNVPDKSVTVTVATVMGEGNTTCNQGLAPQNHTPVVMSPSVMLENELPAGDPEANPPEEAAAKLKPAKS